ncbi:hypothetical protein KSP39_PZI006592 [Platanthera zijinensis]|uniref:Retrotransposon gag domain-containing protein n=1 Tax=Platanthera zijinensis TaxID=2320716 RepID=A0AAP0GAG8_9ASPA
MYEVPKKISCFSFLTNFARACGFLIFPILQELLELGEKIGHASTGLREDEIECGIRKVKHSIFDKRFSCAEMERKCSICQGKVAVEEEPGGSSISRPDLQQNVGNGGRGPWRDRLWLRIQDRAAPGLAASAERAGPGTDRPDRPQETPLGPRNPDRGRRVFGGFGSGGGGALGGAGGLGIGWGAPARSAEGLAGGLGQAAGGGGAGGPGGGNGLLPHPNGKGMPWGQFRQFPSVHVERDEPQRQDDGWRGQVDHRPYVPPKLTRMNFPRYSGGDALEWVQKAELFFSYQEVPKEQWVQLASFHLEDDAFQWTQWFLRARNYVPWVEFVDGFTARCGPLEFEDFEALL